jgi:hypothetical protein
VQNLAEERESKLELVLKIARGNNLTQFEAQGLPLMMQVRALTIKLCKVLKQDLLTMINEEWRDWSPLFHLIDSNAYPQVKG